MAIKYLAVHSSVSIESLRASRHTEPDTPSLISKIPEASLQFTCKGFTCGTHWNFQKYPEILQDSFPDELKIFFWSQIIGCVLKWSCPERANSAVLLGSTIPDEPQLHHVQAGLGPQSCHNSGRLSSDSLTHWSQPATMQAHLGTSFSEALHSHPYDYFVCLFYSLSLFCKNPFN